MGDTEIESIGHTKTDIDPLELNLQVALARGWSLFSGEVYAGAGHEHDPYFELVKSPVRKAWQKANGRVEISSLDPVRAVISETDVYRLFDKLPKWALNPGDAWTLVEEILDEEGWEAIVQYANWNEVPEEPLEYSWMAQFAYYTNRVKDCRVVVSFSDSAEKAICLAYLALKAQRYTYDGSQKEDDDDEND